MERLNGKRWKIVAPQMMAATRLQQNDIANHAFVIRDDHMVTIETVHAEVVVTDPRNVGLYVDKFDGFTAVALSGDRMRRLLEDIRKGLDLAKAVALPVAGVAALRSLRAAGLGPGKRVLVTGASGGVGRFAVQLAARAGAHVIASVGSTARGEGLVDFGADEVLIGVEGLERAVDVVIDSVGGPQLVAAWSLLAPGGSVQSVGWTSGEPAVFPPYATVGPTKSLTSFVIEGDAGPDLAVLTELTAEGALTVEIGWQGSWDRFAEAAEALRGRRVSGKAVLQVTQ
jgi:NADPH:quinone reductase